MVGDWVGQRDGQGPTRFLQVLYCGWSASVVIWLAFIGWRWTNEEGTSGNPEGRNVSLPKEPEIWCVVEKFWVGRWIRTRDLSRTNLVSYRYAALVVLTIQWIHVVFVMLFWQSSE